MEKIKPISPSEVIEAKGKHIPDEVFEAFNFFISRNWNGSCSSFTQNEVMNRVISKMNFGTSLQGDSHRQELFKTHAFDVEDVYRGLGWSVSYDKPGYDETYEATFKFSK